MSTQVQTFVINVEEKSQPGISLFVVFDVAKPRAGELTRVRVANPATETNGKICCQGAAHDFNSVGDKVVPDQIWAKMYRANVPDTDIPADPSAVGGKTSGRLADPVNGGYLFLKADGKDIPDAFGQTQPPPMMQPPHEGNNKLAVWVHFAHNNQWHRRIVSGFLGQSNTTNDCSEM